MEALAHTRILMWEGASLWVVDVAPNVTLDNRRTDFHAHHAIQVSMSLGGRFRLETAELQLGGEAVAVAPDAAHAFAAEGLIALLFIEPESRLGRAAAAKLFNGAALAPVPAGLLGELAKRIVAANRAGSNEALIALGRELVAALAGDSQADVPDLRIRKMIAWAAQQLDGPVSLADAVAVGGLSASRLRHLFVEQTGLPFKTYLLWLRLQRAVERLAAQASLTEAAHDAGFSDSAHFSRTFRRMFGVAPAALHMT